ncbi:HAD-IA family hydrolase [Microlunatus sp. Gsoil 973]|uniref:HAD-IA family hydrolase n=1 Tax=Microlunatus sp. Gsoil 973 TaxID=2672569 RepID=UPI0012B45C48|nr:HAD-IA family hydrolase [Microlunatus sp. Gsoil 973]QGN34046.1 HAD-IA family hydrolase [Microlunatus sp. Gsoil 973]
MDNPISWILFDADGVLQGSPDGWRQTLSGLLGDDPDATMEELFTLEERRALTGGDFRDLVVSVLRRHGIGSDPERVLDCWRLLVVDPSMTERIRRLRSSGVRCGLASNQQNVRIDHMRSMPEYVGLFDAQFYSAELGLAKPDPAFFTEIVRRLAVAPEGVLFVDDKQDNVAGAREAGLQAEVFAFDGGAAELDRILDCHGVVVPA